MKTTKSLLIHAIVVLSLFNLIVPNFLIFKDMVSSYDLMLFLYFTTELIICGISFVIGLEIKRVNIETLKKNNNKGFKASLIFLVISIITNLVCLYLVQNPYVGDNNFFIDRYIDHFCDGFFILSLGVAIFAVFGTDRNIKYPTQQEVKSNRKVIIKKVLLFTSPITIIFAIYLIYIYSYRMSISDFSYFKAEDIESIKINYNNSRQESSFETQEEITRILELISKYSFNTNISTYIPNSSYMSQRTMENEIGKDSLIITIVYKEYDKQVEYLSFIQDGRLRITNIKDTSAYEMSKEDTIKLFNEVLDYIK